MQEKMTRRNLLQAAGGVTFLALLPGGTVAPAIAAEALGRNISGGDALLTAPGAGLLPVFTALPFLQPGGAGTRLSENDETVVLAWQTDDTPAEFSVSVGKKRGDKTNTTVTPERSERHWGKGEDAEAVYDYAASLTNLALGTRYEYRVTMNGATLAEGFFTTRKKRGQKTRFVTFGDNSFGDISDRAIAFQAYQARPDFVMNTGDNVYEGGLVNEYARYFFPVYNANVADERVGAPLLRSVPFYTVIANHDVHDKDASGHPAADFDKSPDSLAYYTNMRLPLNGLETPASPTPIVGKETATQDVFRESAGPRFPRMANYSFDYGDAHFCCLDSNVYVDPTDAALQAWIDTDLTQTDAAWKFVVYHHPAFNVGREHYTEQHMRVLSPIFEKRGVSVVLHGHEHNYQRTVPFKFAPANTENARKNVGTKNRLTPGAFTLDKGFDGKTQTVPNGIIYITTGAGGKRLYDTDWNAAPEKWLHPEDDNLAYIARLVSDRHSLTVIDMDAQSLELKQIDQWGNAIDTCRITKR